jgi:predicted transcriptional regulator
MGKSKNELFAADFVKISEIGKCISHPARVAIIDFLLKSESCVCGDIVAELPLSQSTVSQHLKELKSIGLIKGEIVGPTVCYCIDPEVWQNFRMMMNQLFQREPTASNCGPNCC